MLRQTYRRISSQSYRDISYHLPSSARFIRIRSSNPSSPGQPSPAERPPTVPEEIDSPEKFEPTSTTPAESTHLESLRSSPAEGTEEPAGTTSTPFEPPQPSSPSSAHVSSSPKTSNLSEQSETIMDSVPDYSKLPSLDINPELNAQNAIAEPKTANEGGEGEQRRRTGAGRKEYVSSIDKQRKMWIRFGYGALLVGGVGAVLAMGGEKAGEANGGNMFTTVKTNMSELFDIFNKPAFKTLLPDPLPPPHQRPYTLVIDLEGLLVHSSWDRVHGWRTAKRPGVDYFLGYLSQFYEIVLFTSQPLYTAAPVVEKIDPYQAFMPYRLFRESTRYVNGKVVKDLTYLNRDPRKVVVLDTNAEHVALQPENGIVIKPWDGRSGDKGLIDMIPFLESIGIFAPADVRPILQAYAGKDIPIEYAKKEAEAKQKAIEEWEKSHPTSVTGAGSGFLSGLFGSVAAPGSIRPNQPMTYLEQKRAQAQHIYKEEQKYWAEHADEFKKMIEEDKQRQLAEMKGSLLGFLGAPKATEGPKENVHTA
ncbi:uncharacterized protein L203_102779 [Cryptococcus depauperatus CBS 7841]|uniref:Mitochondrial import inner membrane translocase subunit TIM50 n=1 Tax=Cryptococcus depauperatus CBS 7841 TaxID=1295531 RepID=A0A1E3IB69_9TREE|nr:mitochondrial import inner membrane translocase subunit TIM50 [Cryptococcus depauperatus CBS 7841]